MFLMYHITECINILIHLSCSCERRESYYPHFIDGELSHWYIKHKQHTGFVVSIKRCVWPHFSHLLYIVCSDPFPLWSYGLWMYSFATNHPLHKSCKRRMKTTQAIAILEKVWLTWLVRTGDRILFVRMALNCLKPTWFYFLPSTTITFTVHLPSSTSNEPGNKGNVIQKERTLIKSNWSS